MKKQFNLEVGGRIRKAREALGYSREALAEKADLASSFLGTIELGTGSFTAETMSKLCNALGVSADYILFGTESQNDLSAIHAMLSGLNPEYLPLVEQLLSAYIQSIQLSQNKSCLCCGALFDLPISLHPKQALLTETSLSFLFLHKLISMFDCILQKLGFKPCRFVPFPDYIGIMVRGNSK